MKPQDYARYLKSQKWARIRARVMRRDRGTCRGCGSRATEVHHGSYDPSVIQGTDDSQLYALCRGCHEAITFDALGYKRPWQEVQAATRLLDSKCPSKPKRKRRYSARAKKPKGLTAIRAASLEYAQGLRP